MIIELLIIPARLSRSGGDYFVATLNHFYDSQFLKIIPDQAVVYTAGKVSLS